MKKHCILGFAMLWGQSSADFKFHSTNQWFWNFGKLRPLYLGVSNYVDIFFSIRKYSGIWNPHNCETSTSHMLECCGFCSFTSIQGTQAPTSPWSSSRPPSLCQAAPPSSAATKRWSRTGWTCLGVQLHLVGPASDQGFGTSKGKPLNKFRLNGGFKINGGSKPFWKTIIFWLWYFF